jgi:hypothetical protein
MGPILVSDKRSGLRPATARRGWTIAHAEEGETMVLKFSSEKTNESKEAIPDWLAALTAQDSLIIYRNKAKEIEPHLWKLRHLRKIEMSCVYDPLPGIISVIPRLKRLEELKIVESTASEIVSHLWQLYQLRKIELSFLNDDLKSLPLSLAKLKHLEELNVDGADFGVFPSVIQLWNC